MQTFTPPVNPSPDLGHEVQPRVLVAQFGDGYTQRAGDGLNTLRRRYDSLRWDNLTAAEADAITGFFAARGGVEAFFWTPPDSQVTAKYRAVSWQRLRRTARAFSVQAVLIEEFDL